MRFALITLLSAGLAQAHTVPVDPATCVLDPLVLEQPATGLAAVFAAPTEADRVRLVFSIGSSAVTLCAADAATPLDRCAAVAVPRVFTVGALAGGLTLPVSFRGGITGSGDVVVDSATLGITVDGTLVTPVGKLTTGVVRDGAVVVEGAPFDGTGAMTLVSLFATGTLPPPFDAAPTVLRAKCVANPAPDVDQFALPMTASKLAGSIMTGSTNVKALVRVTDDGVGDLTTASVFARITVDGATVASGVPTLQRKGGRVPATYRVTLAVEDAVLPPIGEKAVDVQLTLDVEGLPVRTVRSFKASRGGTRLKRR